MVFRFTNLIYKTLYQADRNLIGSKRGLQRHHRLFGDICSQQSLHPPGYNQLICAHAFLSKSTLYNAVKNV